MDNKPDKLEDKPLPPSQPTVVGPDAPSQPLANPVVSEKVPKNRRTKLAFIGLVAMLIFSGSVAGAYFGVVMPNNPTNVWKTALTNTHKGYEKLLEYSNELEDMTGMKASGNYEYSVEGVVVDGSFEAQADEQESRAKFDVGAAGGRISLEMLMKMPENSIYPDVYLKASGLSMFSAFVDPTYAQLFQTVDGQWYSVDHTLFDQLASSQAPAEELSMNKEDITAIARTIGDVSRDYLFSTEDGQAVLNVAEYIGKEEVDGRNVYRYKVGIRKDNLKKYATALKDELKKTKLASLAGDRSFEDYLNFDNILSQMDDISETETAEVLVDAKTKLIRSVKFSEGNPDTYTEVGLRYNGGDEFPFYIAASVQDGYEYEVVATLNTQTDVIKVSGSSEGKGEGNDFNIELSAEITPSNEDLVIDIPTDTKPVMELFTSLFGGFAPSALGAWDLPMTETDF